MTATPPGLLLTGTVICLQMETEVRPTWRQEGVAPAYRDFLERTGREDGEWQEGVPSSTAPDSPAHQWPRGHAGKEAGELGKDPAGALHCAGSPQRVSSCGKRELGLPSFLPPSGLTLASRGGAGRGVGSKGILQTDGGEKTWLQARRLGSTPGSAFKLLHGFERGPFTGFVFSYANEGPGATKPQVFPSSAF